MPYLLYYRTLQSSSDEVGSGTDKVTAITIWLNIKV